MSTSRPGPKRLSDADYPRAEPGQVWIGTAVAIQGRVIRITEVRSGRVSYEVVARATHRMSSANHGGMNVNSLLAGYRTATAEEVAAMRARTGTGR